MTSAILGVLNMPKYVQSEKDKFVKPFLGISPLKKKIPQHCFFFINKVQMETKITINNNIISEKKLPKKKTNNKIP